MTHDANFGIYFWGVLLLYGGVMYAMTPSSVSVASFFRGTDNAGRAASQWMLTASIFISWIFAKSVTNAANLGAAYGVVGGYFGPPGSAPFIGSALLFTAVTLLYAVKGGLRSSIITDVLQSAVFILFLGIVLFYGLILCFSGFLLPLWLRKREAAPA